RVDAIAAHVLERAQHIVLVVQQSLTVLRDATRLINCLRRDLAVGKDRIVTVVNRHDKDAAIGVEDIRNTLGCSEVSLVPNDFRTVSECIETGTPLFARARSAAITKAVMALQSRLGGAPTDERSSSLLARTFSSFTRPRSP